MSDSMRERKGQCQSCFRWREGVDFASNFTCGECRLRERCDELERENAALREQVATAEDAAEKEVEELRRDFRDCNQDRELAIAELLIATEALRVAELDAAGWKRSFCQEQSLRSDVTKRAVELGKERDAAIKRASDLDIECGRLQGAAETANALRAIEQRSE
jgi:hypothetical protein